jgi:pimeloyl-ACP methyl ester carboxylesterase
MRFFRLATIRMPVAGRRWRRIPAAIGALLLSSAAFAAPAALEGDWRGAISLPQASLLVSVHFARAADAWSGTIDIPQQGAKGLILTGISFEGAKARFSISGIPGNPTFQGTLEGDRIQGTFTQGAAALPFQLERGAAAEVRRPQTPKPPFPYRQEEVTFTNGGITLAGTLTVPPGTAKSPAVLLVTGSGPQDRDESLFEHKPFWVIADHLSRRGIAVLRFDDRGVGGSSGERTQATTVDFAQDALAGIRFLGGRPEVAADRIGILGHSEGGLVAALAAADSKTVAFAVLLAGPGIPGADIVVKQSERLALAQGASRAQADKIVVTQRRFVELLANNAGDPAVLAAKLRSFLLTELGLGTEAALPADQASQLEAQIQIATSKWYLDFLSLDPRPVLRKVGAPVLALNGSLDVQVDAQQNLPQIERALREAGNRDVTVLELPGLNHLLQPAAKGTIEEYGAIETTIDPKVLDTITDWISKRMVSGKSSPPPAARRNTWR